MKFFSDVLPDNLLQEILNLPKVQKSRELIDKKSSGSIYFTIALSTELKNTLKAKLNLDLEHIHEIPMRWIKGDTLPHIDKSSKKFNETHIVYLTDNKGQLIIEDDSYNIHKNTAYIFNENINHKTIQTGIEPRLLLGPMSEKGISVGSYATIVASGGTTIYIRQLDQSISTYEYSLDNTIWTPFIFPVGISNSDPTLGFIKVNFTTDLTFYNNDFFACNSNKIQFGSETLKSDGKKAKITINGVTDYNGFISNSQFFSSYFSDIYIFNIHVSSVNSSTLNIYGGWLCQAGFAENATNNFIVNCSSDGDITNNYAGGIIGSGAGINGGSLTVIGCSSSGDINADGAGGIVGNLARNVNVKSCWSEGDILGSNAGGIIGSLCEQVFMDNCYSTGLIKGQNSGGIVGSIDTTSSGHYTRLFNINNCYSLGNIGTNSNAGGIMGKIVTTDIDDIVTIVITNCYVGGNIIGSNAGIVGYVESSVGSNCNVSVHNCYTYGSASASYIVGNYNVENPQNPSNPTINCEDCYSEAFNGTSGWNTTHANTVLTDYPTTNAIGIVWLSKGSNQPYELLNMGYTPYSLTNISLSSVGLINSYTTSITKGNKSIPGFTSSSIYQILQINGGNSASYPTITIDTNTGQISTTLSTFPGSYVLYIRNTGSYNISTFNLNVGQQVVPCLVRDTLVLTPSGYEKVQQLKQGDYVITSDKRKVQITYIFDTIINDFTPDDYPCKITKNSIGKNYPSEDFYISQNHLIYYNNNWILPKLFFQQDKDIKKIHYFHIILKNYSTDHLVINNGVVVESLGKNKDDYEEYKKRTLYSYMYGHQQSSQKLQKYQNSQKSYEYSSSKEILL